MTRWTKIAPMIALGLGIAVAGCMSATQVRPSSLTALSDLGPTRGMVSLRRTDGQRVDLPRDVDAELVMTNGTEHSFTSPVSARLAADGSLQVRDVAHSQRVWLDDIVSASVQPHDSGSSAVGTVVGVLAVAAFVVGVVVLAAAVASTNTTTSSSTSDSSGWGDSTTTSSDGCLSGWCK